MFKKNFDSMRMEPTPERVLSVCRLVAYNKMTINEIRSVLKIGSIMGNDADQVIDKSINVACEELNVVKRKDDYLELNVDESILESNESFRKFVSSKIFKNKDSTFVMFSKWYINNNDRILKLPSWESMANTCGTEISELKALNENSVLGWRFWASFLGLGYLSGSMLLPNMKLRIEDLLATEFCPEFKYDEKIIAIDFVKWLQRKLTETDLSMELPLAVSAGLRTLHNLELIRLETWRDSQKIKLFYVDGEAINDFSHITVSPEVKK